MMETTLWQRYQNGRSYQRAMGFTEIFPQCVDFREGRQWPAPTKATRNLPRPVFNLCDKCVRTKRANILNQTIKLIYSPAESLPDEDAQRLQREEAGAKAFSDYAATLWKELGQDVLNEEFIDDAATVGTGVFHYYWDAGASSGERYPCRGALRGETIDPACIFFGNPQDSDVQAQPYILIASRVTVESARDLARGEGLSDEMIRLIVPDEESPDAYNASRHEIADEKKCTLLTLYYRSGGSVYFDRGTRAVEIIRGRALTPGLPDLAPGGEPDAPSEPPAQLMAQPAYTGAKITRYPVVVMSWTKRKRSLYGIGEVEGLIPAQKAVNWLMGMNILSAQDTAWPKMIARPGALRQEITNTPGEIIEDHSATGDGIRYLNPPPVSASTMGLVDKITELVQYTSGVSDIISGEPFTATMAASAIIALQNQAKQPIENIQRRFYRTIEDVGRIWEQFFKTYYRMPRPVAVRAADGRRGAILFVGTDFSGVDFTLDVDAGTGSVYSESLAQATLEKLLSMDKIDVETYIELSPKSIVPFKEQLRRRLDERKAQLAARGEEVSEDDVSDL
jgi:hypothetical protein